MRHASRVGLRLVVLGRRAATLTVGLLIGATACTQIVGPARTYRDYELKAATTAKSVLSSVATARLVVRLGRQDDAFAPYLSVMASQAEDDTTAASGTFAGIQPPDAHADALGARLRHLLQPAEDSVREVRVRARRTELGTRDRRLERRLARSAHVLDRFQAAHS
jgi:hypothetical protein